MIRAIIIDDEHKCCLSLKLLIEKHCKNVLVVGSAHSLEEGRLKIEEEKPDLVFLDVEMPNGNGFNLLESLDKIHFEIIFTTAYDKYALKAIKFSALDYLLKPIDKNELIAAINKVSTVQTENLKAANLLENIKKASGTLAISCSTGLKFVKYSDILRCRADSNYTQVYLITGQKLVSAKSLKEFDELLCEHEFFRIHNSHLVNLKYIKEYVRGDGGFVILTDGTEVEVSTRKKSEFLAKLSVL